MKKKALFLLLVPAAGAILCGCSPKDALNEGVSKVKEFTLKTIKTVEDGSADFIEKYGKEYDPAGVKVVLPQ